MNDAAPALLLSYHYFRRHDLDEVAAKVPKGSRLFADSGAYSVYRSGAAISVKEYGAWLLRWQHVFMAYANLDVIGSSAMSAAGGSANLAQLRAMGLNPVPVYHLGEPLSAFTRMLDDGANYIAVGRGMANWRTAFPWVIKLFELASGKAALHGFGATVWEHMRDVPWYSVDSSSWRSGSRYGSVRLFDDRSSRFVTFSQRNLKALWQHHELIRAHGGDPNRSSRLTTRGVDNQMLLAMQARAYIRAEQYLRKRWGPVPMPRSDAPPGLHLYLATPDLRFLGAESYRRSA